MFWWLGREAPREEIAVREPFEEREPIAAPVEVVEAPPVVPEPAPEPEPAPPEPPAAKREPVAPEPTPKPAPAKPRVVAFANEDEMQRAFDAAVEFERAHTAGEAIANWKEFRGRSPSREFDEKAKRRITELTLGSLPGL